MKNLALAVCCLFALSAFAEDKAAAPAAGGMDMTKMGPAARKPTDEKKTKKEIDDFFKKMEETMKKGDMEASAAMHDFPIWMATDDTSGKIETKSYNKDEFIAMMKPFYENMPKDAKTTHKPTVTVLSDNLATVTDDFTMTMGKTSIKGKNSGLLVKIGSDWKWKSMVEAGWGGMHPAEGGAAKAEPAKTETKQPAAAPAPAPAPAKK